MKLKYCYENRCELFLWLLEVRDHACNYVKAKQKNGKNKVLNAQSYISVGIGEEENQ